MNRTEPALAPGHLRTLAEEAGRRFAAVEAGVIRHDGPETDGP